MRKKLPTEPKIIIGENIRCLRKRDNMTQEDLARILQISHQQVQRYEAGINYPKAYFLYLLAKYFDVSMDNFFDADYFWKIN
jgi:transcriptional regulator with XRE-family HTH domain